jgi:hypothetical protein
MLDKIFRVFMGTALALIFFSMPAFADDVIDSINEGLKYYKNGSYSQAAESLNYASQLIQQKKGESLKSLLPEPLKGWDAQEADSQAMGTAMMGGGLSASRSYTKGDSSVEVRIMTDSPMLQAMMMMFSNPMMAASDGGKMEKISGQKAIVKYQQSERSGEINIMAANRFLVTVEGYDISVQDLKAYAGALDYNKLAALP